MSNFNTITNGIVRECSVFNEAIGVEKDLILINYDDFDREATLSIANRQTSDTFNNKGGLTTIILKDNAMQHIFEGTDYSVIPNVSPEVREDGESWYVHSIAFTVYSKLAKDRDTLISLSRSKVIAVTKDRSTGLYELFGADQGLRLSGIERSYVGTQNSNFYSITIATSDLSVIRESSLGELSLGLDGDGPTPIDPTANTPISFLELRWIAKGVNNYDLLREEIGDIFEGFKDDFTYWTRARWNGGDRSIRANYSPIVENDI